MELGTPNLVTQRSNITATYAPQQGPDFSVAIRSFNAEPGFVEVKHGPAEHTISVSLGPGNHGVLMTEEGRRPVDFGSGNVAVHAAGEPFAAEWPRIKARSPVVHMNISPRFLASVSGRLESPRINLRSVVLRSEATLSRCAQWARREVEGEGMGSRLAWDTLALIASLQLLRATRSAELKLETNPKGLPPTALIRVLERLHDDLGARVSLETLAQDSGMSRFHFCRQFRRSTGLSPYQYQLRIRVERAQSLLSQSPERSLTDVALECGFYDQAHLTRVFRRYVGVTPGRFRARFKSSTPRVVL